MLLSFCKVGALTEENLQQKLKEYLVVAATGRTGTLKDNTNSLNAFMHVLNKPDTPNKIKESFIDALAIDKNKDARFDKTKIYDENIAKFKFTKEDLEGFITKNKNVAPKIQNKYNDSRQQ